MLKIKRVYEKPLKSDGIRILVDRLWPRGLTKQKASIDFWMKDAAPSNALRKWFDHDPERWGEFRSRYLAELRASGQLDVLKRRVKGKVTLVYAAKDKEHNNAVALKSFLEK